jgi:hypothetical protein
LTDAAYRGAFIDPQAGLPVAAAACCAPAVQIIDSATNDARDAGHDGCCC